MKWRSNFDTGLVVSKKKPLIVINSLNKFIITKAICQFFGATSFCQPVASAILHLLWVGELAKRPVDEMPWHLLKPRSKLALAHENGINLLPLFLDKYLNFTETMICALIRWSSLQKSKFE